MPRPPRLTDRQKTQLKRLEPVLRDAARRGDYETAKLIAAEIQDVLRPTGHETRLMQAKNWLFQAAMEADKITSVAIPGFTGVRKKMRPQTRVYLEATALLATCHLRLNNLDKAEPYVAEALRRVDSNITSSKRRIQFKKRMIARFEAEWVLATLRASRPRENLDPDEVESEAGRLVATLNEDEIMERLGRSVPNTIVEQIYQVYDFARAQLPPAERKYLPSSKERRKQKEVGKTVFEAAREVVWRSLCDPENDVYKLWNEAGIQAIVNKKVVGAAVVAALHGLTIGWLGLAAVLTAMIFKMGLNLFCEISEPKGLMIAKNE